MLIGDLGVIFNYIMPYDIDTPNKYQLKAIYEGNEFFAPSEPAIKNIQEEPADVFIYSEDVDITKTIDVAKKEKCNIDFIIQCSDDKINEGVLSLISGRDNIISKANVSNNIATLKWTPTQTGEYSFVLKYHNAIHYNDYEMVINFNVIDGVDEIYLNDISLKQALMCINTNGNIFLTNDININKTLYINKQCNIIGTNDVCINNISDNDIIVNNNVRINNIHFVSDNNILQIINNDNLIINHCILDKNIRLHNNKNLIAQRNFIYGACTGQYSDLDNNWWGSNTPKYDVNNNIIIKIESNHTPPVISEEIKLTGRMVGKNGKEYDLPEANFTFGADTGYFSIDFGKTINNQIQTTYLDAEKEGNIYFTVDNETITYPVYEYERKTEIIIDDISEIPIGYKVPISAKIQSCADIFYDFNNNNIQKSTELINNGHVLFYIDDQQVGYVPVQNGEAIVDVFFTNKYYENKQYTLKAVYVPENYYFESENSIQISIINEDDVCYVSYDNGDNNNDGAFNAPVQTIKKAITLNKQTIYLLDDSCNESNITISHNVTIKSFKNNTIFKNIEADYIFNIKTDMLLNIQNIDFTNNTECTAIFQNNGTLQVNKCIFYKNKRIIKYIQGDVNIKYSAIIDNTYLSNNTNIAWFTYCWFGENNPNINNINYHVQMSVEASKDILYIGTLAHITGMLKYYKYNNTLYKLDEPLPLRIAKFATTYGSMKPLKDYTYDNKSSSLLNTQEENNTNKYIIDIDENTNYINHEVILQCSVYNVHGDSAQGNIKMFITNNNNINISKNVILDEGIARVGLGKLDAGKYSLTCTYIVDNNKYTSSREFIVKKTDIVVKNLNVADRDNLYYLNLFAELEDNFGNLINNQLINISIDNRYITSVNVKKGKIQQKISYSNIKDGQHTLKLDNIDTNSQYDTFVASTNFNTHSKNTQIIFDYNNFEVGINNNINIKVIDDEGNNVDGGFINIEFDNEIIQSEVEVVNGNVYINNFKIDTIGQHSISIYYSGLKDYYNETLYINSHIGVGIFNVIFGIQENEYLHADIGKIFDFSTSVIDIGRQLVNHGYVNIYVDDILLNQNPLYVNNGKISLQSELPQNIISGIHTLRMEYIDTSHTYLDTFLSTFLEIGKIKTNINMDVIYGSPGQQTTVDYQISTVYGSVNSGTLIAEYNGNIIGQSMVSDNINNQIIITVPFLPATDDYIITFKYSDETTYADSILENKLIIQKNNVNIEPSHTWYYPNQLFHFVATITDKDNNMVNIGKASLYIDNVQETESQDIINGQFITSLQFNQARKYPISIVYEDNDYYSQTTYNFNFKINSVDIDNISFKNDNTHKPLYYFTNNCLYSLPEQYIQSELIFTTLDNYNVKDGIVDILIDGNIINSYYIAESNKYIDFNIGKIAKGKHKLTIKYHDSALFNKYEKTINLYILSKQVTLEINDNDNIIAHNHKDSIDIYTVIYDNNGNPVITTGLMRYYIGLPIYISDEVGNIISTEYDYNFIGVQQINNSSEDIYTYTLPTNLLEYAIDKYESHYKIKVEFAGNDEYDEAESSVDLIIEKEDCNILFSGMGEFLEAYYRDTIDIEFNIDAQGSPLVNLYIDDELIGSTIAKNNIGRISYKLPNKYTVKEGDNFYILRASFEGSAVDKPAEANIKMHVHPLLPRIKDDDIEAYYGGLIELDNIIKDVDGAIINDGILTYTIGNVEQTFALGVKGTLRIPETNEESLQLHVVYDTNNSNYSVFEKDINVILKPNDIKLFTELPNKMYRGENYNIIVTATSDTTILPVNIKINNIDMVDGNLELPLRIPLTAQSFNYSIDFSGNQFFNPKHETIEIPITNKNTVTINTEQPENSANSHTLEQAINLVAEYGTIEIINAPDNQNATIDKSITIDGQNNNINNWQITNNSNEVTIKQINFNDSNDNVIINHGEISIQECQFKNGQNSAIYNNGSIIVEHCIFSDNNAQEGAGVYTSNKNYRTIISNCTFKRNNGQGNSSCIFSNKANDVEISNNEFAYNNGTNGLTSSICVNGNAYISSNTFYENSYECEINLLSGTLSAEKNIFDGAIQSIKGYNGNIDADLNYWGYNDIEEIESRNSQLIEINNYLISRRIDYKKQNNNIEVNIVVGVIDQYINRLEKEIITIDKINKDFPVVIGSNKFKINEEIIINNSVPIIIGQERLYKVNE